MFIEGQPYVIINGQRAGVPRPEPELEIKEKKQEIKQEIVDESIPPAKATFPIK